MGFVLSKRSLRNLEGVHEDLCKLIKLSITDSPHDFIIIEGLRSKERQRKLVADGASTTERSRHITGHAIDFVAWVDHDGDGKKEISWHWGYYKKIANHMKAIAEANDIDIDCGADWKKFPDGPHVQLTRFKYPAPDGQ
tara:strand:- start:462 stop:878 length:417 start_codon:yes stop_codon:yes gene_type:complete